MKIEEAIEYWEGLRKTFSRQLEKEENHFGRMHLQTTIDALDMAISALRQRDQSPDSRKMMQREPMTNADRIRAMSDEELAKLLCCTGWRMIEQKECLEWLQMQAEGDDHA